MSTPDPFQEIVDALKRVLTLPATSNPVQHNITINAPSAVTPAPYSGRAEDCNGFILQCTLHVQNHQLAYPTEQAKISFVISLLSGRTLQWAESLWTQARPPVQSFAAFLKHFREVFGRCAGDTAVSHQLYQIRQGNLSVRDYVVQFRTLAAAGQWSEPVLITTYRHGLNSQLQLHLAGSRDAIGLENFINTSIRLSERLQMCSPQPSPILRSPESPPVPGHLDEPMELGGMRLPLSERQRRLTQGLCLYCGAAGHLLAACPIRSPRALPSLTLGQPGTSSQVPSAASSESRKRRSPSVTKPNP